MDQTDRVILSELEQYKEHSKTCELCKSTFIITEKDLIFYKKVYAPIPNICPKCRLQRRLSFRNERKLYKRQCDGTGKTIIARFSPEKPYKVYNNNYYYTDAWDGLEYGRAYNPNRNFFEQYHDLIKDVPVIALENDRAENSDYVNASTLSKDCYLIFAGGNNERCFYSNNIFNCKDSIELSICSDMEWSYQCIHCSSGYQLQYCNNSTNCSNSSYLADCKNCHDCFACVNLRNKSYCIFNVQYTKEDYERKKQELLRDTSWLSTYSSLLLKAPTLYPQIEESEACTGNRIYHCNNLEECYDIFYGENLKYCLLMENAKDCMDYSYFGTQAEQIYECIGVGNNATNIKYSSLCYTNISNLEYCIACCNNTHNCFGCVGLQQKEYCILNTQYSKEEYECLVERIKKDMLNRKEYGMFFPPTLSQFGYNETMAQDFFPLDAQTATQQGFLWSFYEAETPYYGPWYKPLTIQAYHNQECVKEILGGVLQCEISGKPYKVISQELAFYLKFNIPIPKKSPEERIKSLLRALLPRTLWKRNCTCTENNHKEHMGKQCQSSFSTPYPPSRIEKVYCMNCYQEELI